MLVRDWMNPTVISIEAQASMADALQLMKENQIKTLPVFERGALVGVLRMPRCSKSTSCCTC